MIRFSQISHQAYPSQAGVVAIFCVFVPIFAASAPAAENESVDGANSTAPNALKIEGAQVLRVQDVVVGSPVSGVVSIVAVRAGQAVSKGAQLIELNSDRARKELAAAKAEYESALLQSESNVDTRYACRTLEARKRELKQSNEANQRYAGSVTATEIDQLRLAVDQAALSVEQAQQEQDVASTARAHSRVGRGCPSSRDDRSSRTMG